MADQNQVHGVVGYYKTVDGLIDACAKVRDAGFKRWDSYSPFPVHGIDPAMGIRPTILPWITLCMGLTGLCLGIAGQWWVNAIGYDFLISGKPTWSLPANIPVAFEVVIAFSAFTTFFAMLGMNRLPQWSNPLHQMESFRRVTSDRFAICVEATDPNFDESRIRGLLSNADLQGVEVCPADTSPAALPMWFHGLAAVATVLTFVPLAIAYKGRQATSEKPRFHVWADMDDQRKAKAQTASFFFEDGRSDRPPVPGTIAVGDDRALLEDVEMHYGIQQGAELPADLRARIEAGEAGVKEEDIRWISAFPAAMTVDQDLLDRGQQRYGIYCAPCHGERGDGLGSVALRARELNGQRWGWVDPKNLHTSSAKGYSTGRLFDIVSNGISTMKGYGAQVLPEDRWAIVAWVEALQETQAIDARSAPQDVEYRELPAAIESVVVVEDTPSTDEQGGN